MYRRAALLLATALLLTGCRSSSGQLSPTSIIVPSVVAVSIEQVASLVEPLLDPRCTVVAALPPAADPLTWIPDDRGVERIANADIYLALGLPFEEELLDRVRDQRPDLIVTEAWAGAPRRPLPDGVSPSNGVEDEEPIDPFFWLGFDGARHILRTMATELIRLDPEHAAEHLDRMATAIGEVGAFEEELTTAFEPYAGATVYITRPILGYLLDELSLEQRIPPPMTERAPEDAPEGESESTPESTAASTTESGTEGEAVATPDSENETERERLRVIFIQREILTRTPEAIHFDPWNGDWDTVIRAAAAAVEAALRP